MTRGWWALVVLGWSLVGCGGSDAAGGVGGTGGGQADAGADATQSGGTGGGGDGGVGGASAGQGGQLLGGSGGSAGSQGGTASGGSAGSAGASSGGMSSGGTSGTGAAAGAGGAAGQAGAGGTSASPECGDGVKNQSWEQCDVSDFGSASCASQLGSNYSGSLSCTSNCQISTSSCQCNPDCSGGRNCGSNGCGGVCGTCSGNSTCSSGHCTCTPSCAGKQCGDNGCGGDCGPCTGGTTCENFQCKLPGGCSPATTCPTQVPKSSDAQYCLGYDTYTQCVYCPANCGSPHYGYSCTSSGGPPGVNGCVYANGVWCCPTAACMRATPWDSTCAGAGLPPVSYTCHPEASVPAGCVQRTGQYYCCPS
ncbi:MAG: hypothetical protein H6718_19250 [Polyangiaceae bacterium]|nr:hypothetical protein [Myxococcales bacterium]MCB9587547.1 hypothetical protein [Polyangiaceae bacterium]MCB9605656.1 hypothetical protein [Polyangiaceae bacterium]